MRQRDINVDAILQPIAAASHLTGLSRKYIREGCKTGKIPHIKIGADYRVNMPLFYEQLKEESKPRA